MEIDDNNTENIDGSLGASLEELYNYQSPRDITQPAVRPSKEHHVFCEIPKTIGSSPPSPYVPAVIKEWKEGFIRMPYDPESKITLTENGVSVKRTRWEVIRKALTENIIKSVKDLENAIKIYCHTQREFRALSHFLPPEEENTRKFFKDTLPKIRDFAFKLPEILPGRVPLLKQHTTKALTFNQKQVACLLANAFLCTFPENSSRRPGCSEFSKIPCVNFAPLFAADRDKRRNCAVEKLKCILNYFRRVLEEDPIGCITFERRHLDDKEMPYWPYSNKNMGDIKINISSDRTIEDYEGMLQVDFANKYLGGGVLGCGCVQEEIRFVICPELIVGRLFTERLTNNEAVIIRGAERYNNYTGYADNFKWDGDVYDTTLYDNYGRRITTIVAIDATNYSRKPDDQFRTSAIIRELNKAYVGFYRKDSECNPAPVSTGNWGCGAYKGDVNLKFIIQLMACVEAKRNLVYNTFKDEQLKKKIFKMYTFIKNNNITIKEMYYCLRRYCEKRNSEDPFKFIELNYSEIRKNIPFFSNITKKRNETEVSNNASRLLKPTSSKFTGSLEKSRSPLVFTKPQPKADSSLGKSNETLSKSLEEQLLNEIMSEDNDNKMEVVEVAVVEKEIKKGECHKRDIIKTIQALDRDSDDEDLFH